MYKAILFSPDGDFVTDYRGRLTKQEVMDCLADQGSKWYFYPIVAVIVDHSVVTLRCRIVDAAEPWDFFRGGSIGYAKRWIINNPDLVSAILTQ